MLCKVIFGWHDDEGNQGLIKLFVSSSGCVLTSRTFYLTCVT